MFFFLKRPKVTIDCFIDDQTIFNLYPIQKSGNFIPEWYKKAPQSYKDDDNMATFSTMKLCPAIYNTLNTGIVIPMWTDFIYQGNENGLKYLVADQKTKIECHSEKQWEFYANQEKYCHIKIVNPWIIKTKEFIHFHWSYANYHYPFASNDFNIASGIIDYKYQISSHINLFAKKIGRFDFKAGAPIIQLLPLSDKKIEIKNHLVSTSEILKLIPHATTFQNVYKKQIPFYKKQEKKCPFGFGK